MKTITKGLNEWNATVEALGQGLQKILIRTYGTTLNRFLLKPTVSYTLKKDYINSFKKEYQSFAKENSFPKKEGNQTEIKYYAKVEKIIEKHPNRLGGIDKYHIWTNQHVKSYVQKQNPKVWLLRVYKLKEPVMAECTRGQMYVNTNKPISLEGIKPVLSDSEFDAIVQEI